MRAEQRDRETHREDQRVHMHKVEMSIDQRGLRRDSRHRATTLTFSIRATHKLTDNTQTQTMGSPEKRDESQVSH